MNSFLVDVHVFMAVNVIQSQGNVFVCQAGVVSLALSLAHVVTMATTVPQSALVKMAPHVITFRARACVRLDGLGVIVHRNVTKVLSVTDAIRDADVTMVTEDHVTL